MKFKLDENLPSELVAELSAAGHDVETVLGEGLVGALDETVLDRARTEGRVLLTLDKGIGDIRRYPPGEHAGVVLFRPASAGRGATFEFVRARLHLLEARALEKKLVVVTERGIRSRR